MSYIIYGYKLFTIIVKWYKWSLKKIFSLFCIYINFGFPLTRRLSPNTKTENEWVYKYRIEVRVNKDLLYMTKR